MTPTPLSAEAERLVEDHQKLVFHLAMKVYRRLPIRQDLDDLIGYGMIGLIEAASRFNAKLRVEFSTFAWPRINGAIYDGVSEMSWMSRSRYRRLLQAQENDGDGQEGNTIPEGVIDFSSLDVDSAQEVADEEMVTGESKAVRREDGRVLSLSIEALPEREKRLIKLIYIEGMNLVEASERIGVSKSWGSRMHSKSLEKLAREIETREGGGGRPLPGSSAPPQAM